MPHIILPKSWELTDADVTDEDVYFNRRKFMKASAGACAAAALGMFGCRTPRGGVHEHSELTAKSHAPNIAPDGVGPLEYGIQDVGASLPNAQKNPEFGSVPDGRTLVTHEKAASYNNFYEFTTQKDKVWKKVGEFDTRPWTVEVGGLVQRPRTFDVDDLLTEMPHEERIYRFRCVEAWSMVVPWTGFPMRKLLDSVEPLGKAKFVRFWTAERPKQMPGLKNSPWYPWPYHEALRLDEARNDLTLLVTGLYGKRLPRQNGAPLRLIVPWKYGYKSIKSIVRIELVAEKPPTFWNTLAPEEYSFWSNVDPEVPHPRWSQAMERDIQTNEQIPTKKFNGYGESVADLYK
jgi:sulfoxide reductase catalytic subunit YedY